MDNAAIHRYRGLTSVLDELGIQTLYHPPYSPFLNPIENVFSVWKNMVSGSECMSEADLKQVITTTFNNLDNDICEGFYRKMISYLNKSMDQVPFSPFQFKVPFSPWYFRSSPFSHGIFLLRINCCNLLNPKKLK
ncbi:hypothetical protein ECANGB1_979 [Enterospora canceri]|uniref:Tc1-like transposase DDE domain-containing protein n=1 Tax=Enterospora canceri TaxID=1081671 RepID=A0A1Y1S452_9MICR|nr:hypothetical protein ECANGB1_979 [Enterospora canceri]